MLYIYTPYLVGSICLKGCQCHIPTWLTGRDTPSIFTCQKPRLNLTNTERVKAGCRRYLRSPCYPNMTLSSGDVSSVQSCPTALLSCCRSKHHGACLILYALLYVACFLVYLPMYMNTIIDIPPYGCWLKTCVSF